MILRQPPPSSPRPPATNSSDAVTRLRLVRFAHSNDEHVAVIATVAILLIPRFDRLLAAMENFLETVEDVA